MGARRAGPAARTATTSIPHARGLGSSSAAIVAGVCARPRPGRRRLAADGRRRGARARRRARGPPRQRRAGAATAASRSPTATATGSAPSRARGGPARCRSSRSCRRTRWRPRWPAACCPTSVPHADAAANAGRAALLVAALGPAARSCCSPRPRTGCTRTTGARRCRESLALVRALRADGLAGRGLRRRADGAGVHRRAASSDGRRAVPRAAGRRSPCPSTGTAPGARACRSDDCGRWRQRSARGVLGCRCAGDRGAYDAPTSDSRGRAFSLPHSPALRRLPVHSHARGDPEVRSGTTLNAGRRTRPDRPERGKDLT